ncbi:MAG TPA: winged helix-turn-helix domain-containing protein [Caulobacteraceae bacterium]
MDTLDDRITGEPIVARPLDYIELGREEPTKLGPLTIDPARRLVANTDGREVVLEPRIMQVLVALLRARGRIVSRDELQASVWRGVVVGEDSLNRTIGQLRRLTQGLANGVFEIETITKVGYRLMATAADAERAEALTGSGERGRLTLPARPSIAVMPLKNLSGEGDQEYLADAISEDIVTALSRWRWFFVIARHSSFAFKHEDIDPIRVGGELGVRYLLTGGVRTSGSRVRVTVQLIDAISGSNLWAEKFDRQLVDLFALQDEVSEQVVAAIEPAMLLGEARRLERKPPADFSALDCFYRGMWRFNQVSTPAHEEALALFREAVRLDPELVLGHVGVSRALYGRVLMAESEDIATDLSEARATARTAIRLDPREATAHFAASGAELYLGAHATALADAKLALSLNPNFAYAHYRLGQVLIFAGRPEEAIAPLQRSLSLSPCDPQLWLVCETLALAHYQTKDYETAAELARGAERSAQGAVSAVLVASLARLGRLDEAADAMARIKDNPTGSRRTIAAPYASAADRDHIRHGFHLAREALAQRG